MKAMENTTGRMAQIQARIGQIEARIASVSGSADGTFADILRQTVGEPQNGDTAPPAGFRGLPAPPGWVQPVPVQPGAATGVARWEGLIQKYAAQYGVSPDLVRAVVDQESNGDPRVVSRAGAMGLMQLMPANVREAGLTDAFDPEQNIRGGVAQLREHLDRYKGDVSLALAAYNAGPGNVKKYGGIPPFRETQNYVQKILSRLDG